MRPIYIVIIYLNKIISIFIRIKLSKCLNKIDVEKDKDLIFIDEIYSKPPKKNYITNKINIYHIDDTWSIDLLDLNDYGPKNNRGYRYCLIVIDNFSKYGWAIPIKNKNSQTIKDTFEHILTTSKRKPKNLESDRGKEFYNSIFQSLLKINNINHYSRYTDKGPSIVERFNRTIRDMLKKPVFLNGDANWINDNTYNNKQIQQ